MFAVDDGVHEFSPDDAAFVASQQPGMKGDRQIVTVGVTHTAAGVEGVGVAEKSFPFPKPVVAVVDPVVDLSGEDQGQFYLVVPVPGEGTGVS